MSDNPGNDPATPRYDMYNPHDGAFRVTWTAPAIGQGAYVDTDVDLAHARMGGTPDFVSVPKIIAISQLGTVNLASKVVIIDATPLPNRKART